jgi:hypothetical protein
MRNEETGMYMNSDHVLTLLLLVTAVWCWARLGRIIYLLESIADVPKHDA